MKHLVWLAIDEISVGKGHKYLTLVLDLISGAVVFVGKGKGADALRPFWKRLWQVFDSSPGALAVSPFAMERQLYSLATHGATF